jgi:hypothetical protein
MGGRGANGLTGSIKIFDACCEELLPQLFKNDPNANAPKPIALSFKK